MMENLSCALWAGVRESDLVSGEPSLVSSRDDSSSAWRKVRGSAAVWDLYNDTMATPIRPRYFFTSDWLWFFFSFYIYIHIHLQDANESFLKKKGQSKRSKCWKNALRKAISSRNALKNYNIDYIEKLLSDDDNHTLFHDGLPIEEIPHAEWCASTLSSLSSLASFCCQWNGIITKSTTLSSLSFLFYQGHSRVMAVGSPLTGLTPSTLAHIPAKTSFLIITKDHSE